jgi:hypothetical protein
MILQDITGIMGRPADSVTGPFMLRAGLGYEPGCFASWVPYFGVAISADGKRIVSVAVADDFDATPILIDAISQLSNLAHVDSLVKAGYFDEPVRTTLEPGHTHVWHGVIREPCDRCDVPEPDVVFTLDPVCDFCDERHEGPCEPDEKGLAR